MGTTSQAMIGLGTLIKYDQGEGSFVDIAEVHSISGPNITAEIIDCTHMDSPNGYEELLPGIKTGGEVTIEVGYIPDNTTHQALKTKMDNRELTDFKIVFPNTAETEMTFSAYITGLSIDVSVKELLGGTFTLRISGAVTVT